jgi:DNA polymerase
MSESDGRPRHDLDIDFETRSTLELEQVGAHVYAACPHTDVWCAGYTVDDEPAEAWAGIAPDAGCPDVIRRAVAERWTPHAHNANFERVIWHHILTPRYGWPEPALEQWRCSMAACRAAALPGSLDGASAALNLPIRKDAEGYRLMRKMAKPRKPRSDEDPRGGPYWHDEPAKKLRLQQYVMRDAEVERAISKVVPPLTINEQALWQLDARINERGFYTDDLLLDAGYRVVAAIEVTLQEEFRELTGLNSTNQTDKFKAWLKTHHCVVTDIQKETLKNALRRKDLAPEVRRAIELRLQLAHASAAKVKALLAWRGADGRVRGTFQFHGTGTGRWSGHGPQPHNFKKDSDGTDTKIAAIMAGGAGLDSPVEAVGDIARAMVRAEPGHRLFIGDFSGIESRVLAWAAGEQSKIDLWKRFDETGDLNDDPYVTNGRNFGHPESTARPYGKIGDLAFGFNGGVGAWKNFAPPRRL